ncbi:major facilitator superfamily domain-containing protein 2B isoform X2 [Strigops habroptila]|uniref:major facilitator superfamily domain-containing protein 2B isoform X2 n=1 Tax=Strigops habroptila TaxID=2489341 RepID=UPI0011D0196A|nr:major facilitator superfamily domain-containing protein 2B isoform X2 [Strigops habroptila]
MQPWPEAGRGLLTRGMPSPEPGGQRSVPSAPQALCEGGGRTPSAVPRFASAPRPGHAGAGRGWSVRCAMAGVAKGTPERPVEQEEDYRLSVCSKICYAIGGAPNQVAGSAAAFFLQIYLLDIAHITPFHASLVLFIGKASGAVTDPVAGFFISKSRWTKIGRLMPWMLACTPFTVMSYFFMWYLPPFVSGRVVWYLTFYCLFQALTTLFQVPYSALTMFLSTDQKERDSATAYRMTMEVLGTLIGAAVQGQIVASAHVSHHCTVNPPVNTTDSWHDTPSFPDPSDPLSHQAKVYLIAAGVIGSVYLLGIIILFLGVKEKDDPYALNSDRAIPFCKGLGLTMKHGPYVKLTASFLLISTAVQLEQSNFVLFCTHAADLRNHFQYLVVTILWMIPFAVMLVTIPNLILAYFVAFVSGLSIAASLLLPWSMLPDVVDNFRLQNPHGKGYETIFYSSYVFFTKMSAGIGLGISAAGLEFTGYKPGTCRQSNDVILTLKILIGAVPAILILVGLFILLFYPITEESRRETKLALEVLRRSHQSTENLDKEDTSV